MAQGTGLTSRQKKFLEVVLQTPYILKNFYLTGGTALSSWYLHHRESFDLDLFSSSEVNPVKISQWIKLHKKEFGYLSVSHQEQLGFHFFQFKFPNDEILNVDFNYFPSERIEKSLNWQGLEIDSLYNIAVNKLQTIVMSPRSKDYIDLYFILRKEGWSLPKLRIDAAVKHGITTDVTQIVKNFLRVVEFTDYPKMFVPLKIKDVQAFFLGLAKSLEKEIFK